MIYILFAGCSSNQEDVKFNFLDDNKFANTFTKEIPSHGMYKYLKKDAIQIGLDSLESGYNLFQLRVWLGHSMAKIRHIVIIKKTDGKWLADLITFTVIIDENSNAQPVYEKTIKSLAPKSGWKNLLKKIEEYQIVLLPNCEDLIDYNGCGGGDGIDYSFELATKDSYRFYEYCNPNEEKNKFWQAESVLKFANLLEEEFDFKYTK